jgi:NitT/TauT family transport system ATP-binding protein
MQAPALLELRHVTQRYGRAETAVVAIADVSLTLREGELVALLGPSGCGKSTLLRIATGLQAATSGEVLYRGARVEGVNPRAAVVFQTYALFPWLTVQQNVEIALAARGVAREACARRAVEVLDRVGLDGFESAYPRELSGGMRQKAGFARALAIEPELLCLDEPFSALDVLSAEALRGELLELWTSGLMSTRAVLLVTHGIEEAVLMADRIVVMDKRPGRLVAELPVPLTRPRSRRDPRFTELVDRVYGVMAGRTELPHVERGAAPGGGGATRALPDASPHALAGLVEHLAEREGGREDLFRLAAELHLGSEHLLRVTDAGELLGFLHVEEGDATLLPLGERFAREDILERKAIVRAQLLEIPVVRWLLDLLASARGGPLDRATVEAALRLEFSPDDARRQVDALVRWGRYGELVEYDAAGRTLRAAS